MWYAIRDLFWSVLCRLGLHNWRYERTAGAWNYYQCYECCKRTSSQAAAYITGPKMIVWLDGGPWDDNMFRPKPLPPQGGSGTALPKEKK